MRRSLRVLAIRALGAIAFSLAPLGSAAAEGDVAVLLSAARVVVGEHGAEQLVTTETVHPGDVVEYRATYSNQGESPVRGLAATLPIPPGTIYQPRTTMERVEASLDGESFAPVPLLRQVVGPDGRLRTEEVPASEYRALRWQLGELPANAVRSVAARVLVPSARAAAGLAPAAPAATADVFPADAERVAVHAAQ